MRKAKVYMKGIEASFLLPETKKTYLAEYRQRRNRLKDMR